MRRTELRTVHPSVIYGRHRGTKQPEHAILARLGGSKPSAPYQLLQTLSSQPRFAEWSKSWQSKALQSNCLTACTEDLFNYARGISLDVICASSDD